MSAGQGTLSSPSLSEGSKWIGGSLEIDYLRGKAMKLVNEDFFKAPCQLYSAVEF